MFSCVYASFLLDKFYENPLKFGKESGKYGFYYMTVFILNYLYFRLSFHFHIMPCHVTGHLNFIRTREVKSTLTKYIKNKIKINTLKIRKFESGTYPMLVTPAVT
jgi:hypothetical protein